VKRLTSVLLGSVIAAAFLGPGTVTTAARAGAAHAYELLWTLVFATVACAVLQEAGARLTVVSGHNLGEALRRRFAGGWRGALVLGLAAGAILGGCAAYEAGNILGGVAGAELTLAISRRVLTLLCVAAAGALLWLGGTRAVIAVMALLVAVMGGAFLATAFVLRPELPALAAGLVVPRVPAGSTVLVLGLIGTTVVPYNLFLGSGIARGQELGLMRFGLAVAIGLGGLISMAVVVVGHAATGGFSYEALAATLAGRLGGWARGLFSLGLFAAGFSSAITAPLAAAVTARSLFAAGAGDARWADASWRYRGVWLGVLAVGAAFGLADVRPIPVIVLAQALNGVLLPIAAVFLLLAVNDRELVGGAVNGAASNAVATLAVAVTVLLGVRSLAHAAGTASGAQLPEVWVLAASAAVVAALALPVARGVRRLRRPT
jgi:Mn2+/Fe2+ NRAMP family transporter